MSGRIYDSSEGEFVDFETLDDWEQRDKAKNARISALEDALAKADDLAEAAYRTIHDDADTSLVDALTAYRQARDATR